MKHRDGSLAGSEDSNAFELVERDSIAAIQNQMSALCVDACVQHAVE
jgi:hypothetical protein